jgi:hypothetical protein
LERIARPALISAPSARAVRPDRTPRRTEEAGVTTPEESSSSMDRPPRSALAARPGRTASRTGRAGLIVVAILLVAAAVVAVVLL